MPNSTPNLDLLKYDTVADKNRYFNINESMNDNWDKIDAFCKNLSDSNSAHTSNKSNPHSVTKAQVGLGQVDNTSDLNKPVSNAVAELLESNYQSLVEKNAANGYAGLNEEKKVPCKLLSAAKLAYVTGEVMTDDEILTQLKELKCSAFDRSKFTVVGSPVITDDGIVSGFSTSNYITASGGLLGDGDWEIIVPYTTPSDISSLSGANGNCIFSSTVANEISLRFYGASLYNSITDTNGANIWSSNPSVAVTASTSYLFKVSHKSGKYYFDYSTDNGATWTNVKNETNANLIKNYNSAKSFCFGIYKTDTTPISIGSIDFKQFSIIVDGVPVFSGNKTGIDTIKPDDYTPEGSIASNIADDGIVVCTTTGSTDYIDKSISIPQGSKLRIEARLRTPKGINASGATGASWLRCYLSDVIKLQTYMSYWGFTFSMSSVATGNVLERSIASDTWYKFLIEYDGTDSYTFNVKKESDTTWTSVTKTGVTPSAIDEIRINSELNNTTGGYTFDLNAFKIYVDGNLVYQPCLKIPYTESKTGSKIVNSIYRDRVNDMYEQFGYAPYYTLSDTDFTLPQGELYGYLEKRARDIAHPVGVPFYRFSDEINEDEVRLEGAEVDKGLYLAIEQKLSALCTAGSTADKVCLPDFRNRTLWGANDFGYVEAGLPDHSHNLNVTTTSCGADPASNPATANMCNGDHIWTSIAEPSTTNASVNNSIYGNSTTVQPPAVKVRWLARWK